MDLDVAHGLQRTASAQSSTSARSRRSQTVRTKSRKNPSYPSSSASSIAASDKSLTSFPSLSPESPVDERKLGGPLAIGETLDTPSRKFSNTTPSIVDDLTSASPSQPTRRALFDDAPLSTNHVPGAIHQATDEHIERLIARTGAATLVRQLAEDLAQRDAEIVALRRKTDRRERALRKVISECGLSTLDLETRLRTIEDEAKDAEISVSVNKASVGLEHLIIDAMDEHNQLERLDSLEDRAITAQTMRSRKSSGETNGQSKASKGWKDYIWGGSTSQKGSQAGSINGDTQDTTNQDTIRASNRSGRRAVAQISGFQSTERPGERSSSRASSLHSDLLNQNRKSSLSLAAMALKLVAGNPNATRDSDSTSSGRARASSAADVDRGRTPSAASARTSNSAVLTSKQPPKAIPQSRKPTAGASMQPPERWDTMGASPQSTMSAGLENFGPVEMDTILPPEAQPPTLTHIYNNQTNSEFLTDRFGFIYDQRRKKRQREAAETVLRTKGRSRVEMLSGARGDMSPTEVDFDVGRDDESLDARPDTPLSAEDRGESSKPAKRWQDYLKIATFPTELLSHTPSGHESTLEVFTGEDGSKSPGITTENRGFLPPAGMAATPPTTSVVSDNATISKPIATVSLNALAEEDVEPVKLLLKQLGEVHDSLQRDKTVRWNDFLRKVRAERRREGEAAAAETRSRGMTTLMPETSLADGEIIGISGLGNKGKVGRAKWIEFKSLVLGGIPVAYRAKIWSECSGASTLRIPGYYDDLIAKGGENDDPVIVSQIQMDINRTLTDNIFFRRGPGVTKLNEVLLTYSRRNPEVGYCQGMNLITACLLLIMPSAEDAFWILASIIERILPQGYYDHSLLASRADQLVLRQYVAEILPKLSGHLDELSIELEALTFQWFLSVFTDCLSAEALFRVWDVVLCINDGSTFLFQVALALLKLNEQQLLQCLTPASIYTYINHQMTNHAISIDGLIHASEGLRKVLKREDVESRRAKAIEAEKDLMRQREARNNLRKAERLAALSKEMMNKSQGGADDSSGAAKPVQLELGADEYEQLTVRTPIPMEEERDLALG